MNSSTKKVKSFLRDGYIILNLFDINEIILLKKLISKNIKKKIRCNINSRNLSKYHKLVNNCLHKEAINKSNRYVRLDKNLINKIKKNKVIIHLLNKYWGHDRFKIKWIGSLKDREIKDNCAGFRLARPITNSDCKITTDAAGAHCDLHVGGKISNDKKIMITAWTPIIGLSKKYTLKIAPRSHLLDHPFSKIISKTKSVSRVLKNNYLKKFKFKRFCLKPGQVIIFHPNLIHGGADNIGHNTRVSIEIRIFNLENAKKFPYSLKEIN